MNRRIVKCARARWAQGSLLIRKATFWRTIMSSRTRMKSGFRWMIVTQVRTDLRQRLSAGIQKRMLLWLKLYRKHRSLLLLWAIPGRCRLAIGWSLSVILSVSDIRWLLESSARKVERLAATMMILFKQTHRLILEIAAARCWIYAARSLL